MIAMKRRVAIGVTGIINVKVRVIKTVDVRVRKRTGPMMAVQRRVPTGVTRRISVLVGRVIVSVNISLRKINIMVMDSVIVVVGVKGMDIVKINVIRTITLRATGYSSEMVGIKTSVSLEQ